MKQIHVTGITITSARFFPSSAKRSARKQQLKRANSKGASLALSGKKQTTCPTASCRKAASNAVGNGAKSNSEIRVPVTLSDGEEDEVDLTFESFTDTSTGK